MGMLEEEMYRSIVNGDVHALEQLLTVRGADPEMRYHYHNIPALNFAIMRKQQEIARVLLLYGASVNQTDNHQKKSALHCAVLARSLPMVEMLLHEGANPNLGDVDGSTPVHYAACLDDLRMFTALVDAGGDVEARDRNRRTALLIACALGNLQVVNYLLDNCAADVTVRDINGNTAFHLYKVYPLSLCKKLISKGASVTAVNSSGQSALYLYVNWLSRQDIGSGRTDCYRCLYLLLLNGADPNQRWVYYPRYPLSLAVCNRDLIAVSMMLSFGANPDFRDTMRETPALLPTATKNVRILQLFYYNGMNPCLWDEHNKAAKIMQDRFVNYSMSDVLISVLTGEVQLVKSLQYISALALRRSLGRNADSLIFNSSLPTGVKNRVVSFAYYVLFARAAYNDAVLQ
uniref:ANK_REP_REGION domain-containing protein n=1 Tax=Trichuris muris TaxID=70415 RepID=A0A5S6QEM1_TRIMR